VGVRTRRVAAGRSGRVHGPVTGSWSGLVTAFAVPLAREGTAFAGQLPHLIDDARAGRGAVGGFLDRTHALTYVQDHQDKIKAFASGLTTPATRVLRGVATGVAGVVTIFVLAYLMVLEGPKVVDGSLNLLHAENRPRVRAVAADCAKSITGYLSGNLLISVICGIPSRPCTTTSGRVARRCSGSWTASTNGPFARPGRRRGRTSSAS